MQLRVRAWIVRIGCALPSRVAPVHRSGDRRDLRQQLVVLRIDGDGSGRESPVRCPCNVRIGASVPSAPRGKSRPRRPAIRRDDFVVHVVIRDPRRRPSELGVLTADDSVRINVSVCQPGKRRNARWLISRYEQLLPLRIVRHGNGCRCRSSACRAGVAGARATARRCPPRCAGRRARCARRSSRPTVVACTTRRPWDS